MAASAAVAAASSIAQQPLPEQATPSPKHLDALLQRHQDANGCRRGLSRGDRPAGNDRKPFVVEPQACGLMPSIDPLRFNQLVDDLELEAFQQWPSEEGERA